jgi:selenide,water dikinase
VNACTDVTGFGLMGHLHEVTQASGVNALLNFKKVPFMESVESLVMVGAVPGGTHANTETALEWTDFGPLSQNERFMLCDAQTSGGLLVFLQPAEADKYMAALKNRNIFHAVIGKITGNGSGLIQIDY